VVDNVSVNRLDGVSNYEEGNEGNLMYNCRKWDFEEDYSWQPENGCYQSYGCGEEGIGRGREGKTGTAERTYYLQRYNSTQLSLYHQG
jgi:hypothetical protein